MNNTNQTINLKDLENVINYSRKLELDLKYKHQTLIELDQYLDSISIPNSTSNRATMNNLIKNQKNIKTKTKNNKKKIKKSLKNLEKTLKKCKSNELNENENKNVVIKTPISKGIRKNNPFSNKNTLRYNNRKNKSRKKIRIIRE